jgi:hypothetical protein
LKKQRNKRRAGGRDGGGRKGEKVTAMRERGI